MVIRSLGCLIVLSFGILFISVSCLSPAMVQETTDLAFILKSNPIKIPQFLLLLHPQ